MKSNLRTDFETSIYSDAYALQSLKKYQQGKLILHSWLTRGLVTVSQIAKWRFQGDETKVKELMKSTKGYMHHLLSLEKVPSVGDDDEKAISQLARMSKLEGEASSTWCVMDEAASSSDSKPTPLPHWFQIPIDKTIAIWKREKEEWEKKRNSRFAEKGDYTLTKAAEEKYQAWLIHAQSRRIVLNKVRQAQVVNIHNKSLKSINKNCILLKVHLGDDTSSLQLSAGDGKKYQLRLMQGVQPSDDIPAGLDQLPGETSFVESCRVMIYIYIFVEVFVAK